MKTWFIYRLFFIGITVAGSATAGETITIWKKRFELSEMDGKCMLSFPEQKAILLKVPAPCRFNRKAGTAIEPWRFPKHNLEIVVIDSVKITGAPKEGTPWRPCEYTGQALVLDKRSGAIRLSETVLKRSECSFSAGENPPLEHDSFNVLVTEAMERRSHK